MATIDLMDRFGNLGEGGIRNNGTLDSEVLFQPALRTMRTDFIQVKAGDSIVYKNMNGMASSWNILSFYTAEAQGSYVSGIAGQTTPQSGVWTAAQDGYVRIFGSFPAGDKISVTMTDLAPDVEDYLAQYNAMNYRFLPNSIPKIVAHIQEYLSNHPIADSTTLQAVIDAAFQSYMEEIQQTADTYIAEAVPPAAAAAVDAAASPALEEINAKAAEAAESARQAGLSQQSAEMSEENALTYRNQAQQIKDSITSEVSASVLAAQEQATLAQESAQAADESADTAEQYVAQARAQAEAAADQAQTASGYASDAQGYMQDASGYAQNASDFADNAAQSAATFSTDPTLTIAGKAADAKATGDQLSALKSHFDACLQENSAFIDLSASNILQSTTKDGCYPEVLTGNTPKLRLSNNSIYKSFYFIATKPINIYYDATTLSASGFVAIATLENPSALVQDSGGDYWYGLNNERPVRYRLNDGDLPSANNKLHVSTGTLVVASYQTNITIANASKIHVEGLTYELTDSVSLQESQIKPFLKTNTVAKGISQYIITNGNARYYVNYYNNNNIRVNLWRTNKCEIKADNGSYFTLWKNSDADGVVQLNEDDFIGGYHGDEIQTLVHMYVDGSEVMPSDTFEEKAYKEIVMMFTSNVYHCNTSQEADRIAFIRNKVLIFNENGFTVKNDWIAQEDLSYILAYMGMLSIERYLSDGVTPLIKGYYTNKDYVYKDNATATERSDKITNVHFVTAYGDASISIKYPADASNCRGHVQDYNTTSQQRLKAYLGYGYGVAIPLATGDILQAEATIKI